VIAQSTDHRRLERLLAIVLRYSTWLASAVITFGVIEIVAGAGGPAAGARATTIGIAMLILIPVLRVVLMALVFAFQREYVLLGVAALVLSIIGLGVLLGMRGTPRTTAPHALTVPPASRAGAVLSLPTG
jgi:uncharacterized membrane protein